MNTVLEKKLENIDPKIYLFMPNYLGIN